MADMRRRLFRYSLAAAGVAVTSLATQPASALSLGFSRLTVSEDGKVERTDPLLSGAEVNSLPVGARIEVNWEAVGPQNNVPGLTDSPIINRSTCDIAVAKLLKDPRLGGDYQTVSMNSADMHWEPVPISYSELLNVEVDDDAYVRILSGSANEKRIGLCWASGWHVSIVYEKRLGPLRAPAAKSPAQIANAPKPSPSTPPKSASSSASAYIAPAGRRLRAASTSASPAATATASDTKTAPPKTNVPTKPAAPAQTQTAKAEPPPKPKPPKMCPIPASTTHMKRVEDTVEQATKKINAIGCAQGQKPVAKNLSCKAISGIAGIGASGVCEADIYCSATELPCGSQASSF